MHLRLHPLSGEQLGCHTKPAPVSSRIAAHNAARFPKIVMRPAIPMVIAILAMEGGTRWLMAVLGLQLFNG